MNLALKMKEKLTKKRSGDGKYRMLQDLTR